MPAIGAGGRRSVSRHTFLAFLGDPPQRLCKGFQGGKQDSPLCALFTSFLWRQRKDVPPRHERFRKTKRFYRKYGSKKKQAPQNPEKHSSLLHRKCLLNIKKQIENTLAGQYFFFFSQPGKKQNIVF